MKYASITDRLAGLGSGKWAVHHRARAMKAEGREVIELTIGEPDIAPDAALLDICDAAMRAGRTRYSNGRGEPGLLAALAAKYSRRSGRGIGTDQILCFPGTQSALYAVMAGLVEAGDSVLIPDPYYATYEGVVRSTGATVVPVPTWDRHRFHLQAADLDAAITPGARVLLLNTPHNPTGAVLTADEIAAIGEVCRKHDLWIVCDEVYEELILEGSFASPFDRADLADRTIVVSSISKSHAAPGFRSGWAVGPVEFCARLLPVSEIMLFGGQPFIADMTAYALGHDIATAGMMREAYRRRAGIVMEALKTCPALRALPPEAGMFILIDVRGTGLTGDAFARGLLEAEAVAAMPGSSFGAQAEGFIRLSLTVPDETLAEACRRIARFAVAQTRKEVAE
jgi:arginine:pyruvate transaminase